MTKNIMYQYLGSNGVVYSPSLIEGAYSVKKILLIADDEKKLTKDDKNFVDSVMVPEAEVEEWKEV